MLMTRLLAAAALLTAIAWGAAPTLAEDAQTKTSGDLAKESWGHAKEAGKAGAAAVGKGAHELKQTIERKMEERRERKNQK